MYWVPIFFHIYQYLHSGIKFSQSFHFVDDKCLLNIQSAISKINGSLNKDLKELSFCVNENQIALNIAKTVVILFKPKHKPFDTNLKVKLCKKILYKTKCFKYLGTKN